MRNFLKSRFFKRKAKAKGNIWTGNLCISGCMLIKNQKAKKVSVNLATKGIKLTSLWLKKVKITLISVYCEHM